MARTAARRRGDIAPRPARPAAALVPPVPHPPQSSARMRLAPGSMLILTVGDYGDLAPHKGEAYARFFAGHGLTCHVLA